MIEKKIQGYAQRMSELESTLVDEVKEEDSLKQQDEALVQQRSLLLQKRTVVEKRVYGSFLEEIGVSSIQELESEYMAKLRENESMQTECRTHITLIESKREYNTQRLQAIAQSVKEFEERRVKVGQKAQEAQNRLNVSSGEMSALEEEEEQGRREIAQVQKSVQDIEIVIQEIDVRIRNVVAESVCEVEPKQSEEDGGPNLLGTMRDGDTAVETQRGAEVSHHGAGPDSASVGTRLADVRGGEFADGGGERAVGLPSAVAAVQSEPGACRSERPGAGRPHRLFLSGRSCGGRRSTRV